MTMRPSLITGYLVKTAIAQGQMHKVIGFDRFALDLLHIVTRWCNFDTKTLMLISDKDVASDAWPK